MNAQSPTSRSPGSTAGVSADGLHVTVAMSAPRTPCGGPAPVATPFATETTITPPAPAPATGRNCADDLVLRMIEYRVELTRPLGNRVLLGA